MPEQNPSSYPQQDLKWEIQEMLQDGNRVIVRSMASGSPKGDFMGTSLDGSKSFNVMTIDVHTVEDDQIKQVYHLEDWTSAIKQLNLVQLKKSLT